MILSLMLLPLNSFTQHFYASCGCFPPIFSTESWGRLTFKAGEKGGHMVVKTTVSSSPEERKVKEEGSECTEASQASQVSHSTKTSELSQVQLLQ